MKRSIGITGLNKALDLPPDLFQLIISLALLWAACTYASAMGPLGIGATNTGAAEAREYSTNISGFLDETNKPQNEAPRFDFVQAKLDGKDIFRLSLDLATDLLGRPSSVEGPKEYPAKRIGSHLLPGTKFGAQVAYEELGIHLVFAHPDEDQEQKCVRVEIFLVDTSQARQPGRYKQFRWSLPRNVTGNWKAKKVLDDFSDLNPKDMMQDPATIAEQQKAQALRTRAEEISRQFGSADTSAAALLSGAENGEKTAAESAARIVIQRPGFKIEFKYEKSTTFLEKISVFRSRI